MVKCSCCACVNKLFLTIAQRCWCVIWDWLWMLRRCTRPPISWNPMHNSIISSEATVYLRLFFTPVANRKQSFYWTFFKTITYCVRSSCKILIEWTSMVHKKRKVARIGTGTGGLAMVEVVNLGGFSLKLLVYWSTNCQIVWPSFDWSIGFSLTATLWIMRFSHVFATFQQCKVSLKWSFLSVKSRYRTSLHAISSDIY